MKKLFFWLVVIVIAISLLFVFFVKPFVLDLAVKGLRTAFKASDVSIGHVGINSKTSLIFSNVVIKKAAAYDIALKTVIIYVRPHLDPARVNIRFYAGDGSVNINAGNKELASLLGEGSLPSGRAGNIFSVTEINISNLAFKINAKDLSANGNMSVTLNVPDMIINYLKAHIESARFRAISLEGADLNTSQLLPPGDFYIKDIKYGKFKIEDLKGALKLDGNNMITDSFSAGLFGGHLEGEAGLGLDKNMKYLCNFRFDKIDIDAFVREGEMTEKFTMTGKIKGGLLIKGDRLDMSELNGEFFTLEDGGTLAIKDKTFLENMAKSTNQAVELLAGSFQEYKYDTGKIRASIDSGGNLLLGVALEGAAGKRDLNIVLHDFTHAPVPLGGTLRGSTSGKEQGK